MTYRVVCFKLFLYDIEVWHVHIYEYIISLCTCHCSEMYLNAYCMHSFCFFQGFFSCTKERPATALQCSLKSLSGLAHSVSSGPMGSKEDL